MFSWCWVCLLVCVSSPHCSRHKRVIAIRLYCSLYTEPLPQDIQDAITEEKKYKPKAAELST